MRSEKICAWIRSIRHDGVFRTLSESRRVSPIPVHIFATSPMLRIRLARPSSPSHTVFSSSFLLLDPRATCHVDRGKTHPTWPSLSPRGKQPGKFFSPRVRHHGVAGGASGPAYGSSRNLRGIFLRWKLPPLGPNPTYIRSSRRKFIERTSVAA